MPHTIFVGVPYSDSKERMRDAAICMSMAVSDFAPAFLPISPHYTHGAQCVEHDLNNIRHIVDAVYLPHPNLLHSATTEQVVRVAQQSEVPVFSDLDKMSGYFSVDENEDDVYTDCQLSLI